MQIVNYVFRNQMRCQIALWIGVDQKYSASEATQSGCQMKRKRGLTHPALVVVDDQFYGRHGYDSSGVVRVRFALVVLRRGRIEFIAAFAASRSGRARTNCSPAALNCR